MAGDTGKPRLAVTNFGHRAGLRLAAMACVRYKLAMADAIIWQTAQEQQAELLTQDFGFKYVPGVQYRAKVA